MKLIEHFKKIAGLNVKLSLENNKASQVLLDELNYYPNGFPNGWDLEFCFWRPVNFETISNNPSSHFEFSNGIGTNWGGYSVVWTKEDRTGLPKVFFYLTVPMDRMLNKLKGMQYTHPYEEIGQIFHEGVLQPSLFLYFSQNISLIHGSSVISPSGKTITFGGTGGVGKTSLELELILNKDYSFIADDISILDNKGYLLPNFNLPKIYGYNLLGYRQIEKKLFENKTNLDKLWWNVQKKLKAPNRYRRRADIDSFYSGRKAAESKFNRYIILYRSNVPDPVRTQLTAKEAARMNTSVMYTELARLFNTLKLHEYNRIKDGLDPLFSFENLMAQSEKNLCKTLEKIECDLLQVPMDFTAMDVKEKIPGLLGLE